MSLEGVLGEHKRYVCQVAKKKGLDFFEVIFEMLDADQMNAVAAYGGFPNRYPHWRFGMEYERLGKTYDYGFSKIYEMVVNNDPCYAYLMRANSLVDQKLVMAHVYGHSDFFKNNIYYAHTNRKMMDVAGSHRAKIQRMMSRLGQDTIEDFIDICLSLETLVDINAPMRAAGNKEATHFPEKDVLLYLLERAPLESWQQEVLSIIREEAYYFAPQRQTKIMNEGWASYWHSKLMTEEILEDAELIDYADRHSGSMHAAGGAMNPYKIGIEMFRDIEERWNAGRFGREYEECDDMHKKEQWDLRTMMGQEKIFEVRKLHNDVTFLDTFLTPELCERLQLFTYAYDQKSSQYEVRSRDFPQIKKKLLDMLTNGGNPVIGVIESHAEGADHLYLKHVHEGTDLKYDYARETMKNLYALWKRPVHLETVIDEVPKLLSYDGSEQRERRV